MGHVRLKIMSTRKDKLLRELLDRYKLIRAIHTCYYTQLNCEVERFSPEFFYVIGDVIEGKPIDESTLRYLDMDRVREFLKEDK